MDLVELPDVDRLTAALAQETHRIKESVMAKVIEFYIPKSFRRPLMCGAPMEPGKVIEFRSQTTKPIPARSTGWTFGWLHEANASNCAVVVE
jgi:hypothetical protein